MREATAETPHPRDDSELGALAELVAVGFGGTVARVQELHEAVARRSSRPTGSASAAPRAAHDAIAGGVYAAVRRTGALLGAGVAKTLRAAGGGPRIPDRRRACCRMSAAAR